MPIVAARPAERTGGRHPENAVGPRAGGDAICREKPYVWRSRMPAATRDPRVDSYLACAKRWRPESERLREILLSCGLNEALKWGKPCYAHGGGNIAILQSMKDFLALMFFKGALLRDADGALEEQGPNSRSARRLRFVSLERVAAMEKTVRALVGEAIEVERAGLSVPKPTELKLGGELRARLEGDPPLRAAFAALTPGRQREYNLYFSGAKQPETRANRVEKYVSNILAGKGFRDR